MDNPYFAGCGDWPGWPAALDATLNHGAPVRFYAISWQELLPLLPLDPAAAAWASEKHGCIGLRRVERAVVDPGGRAHHMWFGEA